jgi:hypothetical protein
MTTLQRDVVPVPATDQEPDPGVVDWRPNASTAVTWNVVGVAITVAGLALFALPVMLRSGSSSGSGTFGLLEVVAVVGLTALLMALHEAIHGLVMLGFGARPRFGALLIAHVLPALYATAPGHQFGRGQYLVVALAPTVVISGLGFLACFGAWAGYLVVPLAIHFGGCVGDWFASARTLREPSTTRCEDLRDGIRFHRLRSAAPAATEG